jgi:hypothetical protein
MGKKSKQTSTNLKKTVAPFITTTYPQDYLNKTVGKVVESGLAVKNNPQLVVDWAKEHPVSAVGMTGLAVGSYVGYSHTTGEYKIPGYEFNVSENASVKIEGGIGLNGEVKDVGVAFRWKF